MEEKRWKKEHTERLHFETEVEGQKKNAQTKRMKKKKLWEAEQVLNRHFLTPMRLKHYRK